MEKYTNLQELGQGAFGKVYKADREEDCSTHALKCLTVDSIDKGQVVLKEIHALQQVGEHPNIMQFTDAFTEGGGLNTPAMNVWLVLEYCNGGTLDSFILGSNPDRTSVLQLLCDTAEGVAYLHGRNIVHRDLKPDNILVDNSGQRPIVKIADFGIARVCEQSGWDINSYYMQTAVGTRLYLSPEIIGPLLAQQPDQVTYTAKTDVFALGLIIAALLDRTTVPFNPGKVTPFLPDPVNGQPTAVAEVMVTHPEYPAADMLLMSEPPGSPVKALVLAMLAADPHQRPTSEQVLGTLGQITNSPHTAAILASPVMPPPPPYTVVEVPVESSEPETWQDRLSSCCAACWRCDDGEEWYHLAGKGPGWVIVLLILWLVVIMAVIIAVFCVVAYMCFCCVLACLSHEEEVVVVMRRTNTNLLGALVAVGTLGAFSD
ncbi:PDIK1L [Branchiostoma lanceolatum]|uniref:PDIK1L protein n=1 Tax=Branchiostoma lanceolatum TaxID=7740 RepID=A0A8K0ENB0_BRALA|nr:PDIK1L [Branchiostoma lanceolatum]